MWKHAGLAIAVSALFALAAPSVTWAAPALSASPAASLMTKVRASGCVYGAGGRLVCNRYKRHAHSGKHCCDRRHHHVRRHALHYTYSYRVWPYYSYRREYDYPFNYYRSYYAYRPYDYYRSYWYEPYHPGTFALRYDYPFRVDQVPYARNPW